MIRFQRALDSTLGALTPVRTAVYLLLHHPGHMLMPGLNKTRGLAASLNVLFQIPLLIITWPVTIVNDRVQTREVNALSSH